MTSQKAKDIIKFSRALGGDFDAAYHNLIENTCSAFMNIDKNITEENMKIVLNGFAISIILEYIYHKDLESETDTFLTNSLVDDVTSIMWEDWLKESVIENENRKAGDNVVQLKAIN